MMGPVIAALKAGDVPAVARLVPAGVNNQPDFFETAPPEIRSMFLDNARTVKLLLAAPPPPPITCDQLRQIKIPVLISRGEATRTTFRISTEGAAIVFPGLSLPSYPAAAISRWSSSPRRSTRHCCNSSQRRARNRSPDERAKVQFRLELHHPQRCGAAFRSRASNPPQMPAETSHADFSGGTRHAGYGK